MKGYHLFRHALAMVLRDLPTTTRLTAVPYAIGAIWSVWFAVTAPTVNGVLMIREPSGLLGVGALCLLSIVSILWLAVVWHRYVLLGEAPKRFLPEASVSRMKGYLIKGILTVLVTLPVAGIFGVLSYLLSYGGPLIGAVMGCGYIFALVAVIGRVSAILPAVAVDRPISLRESWAQTKQATPAIVVAFLMAGVTMAVASMMVLAVFLTAGKLAYLAIPNFLIQWFSTVLGLSLITTIYGHYIEGRELT
ncbi:hypothetical protein PARPLA_00252 [Rhodobacteraceae bacterium THAF1]|uniref:hypothetical protein n=1 Tax=Palleronia sp. THAF1 TaxID=2587842 RepID=UPI000F3C78CA|nr:hypothetical protein [Palleronia sp. THAF1]QFU10183.1 hypothetical protein FIU81_16000 [Palleronia sp. THAF1]VDC16912.1 hypothetical protein PARPLA_00252 [Rhodobacteraceae bacterium THAF1]